MHDQHFEAGIVVQVGMAGGDHQFVLRVLHLGQFFRDAAGVVVVDERDGANDNGVGVGGLFCDQPVANEISKRL